MVARDPHERLSERAADGLSAERGSSNLTPLQQAFVSAVTDAGERDRFEHAVREFTVAARRSGYIVERIIIGLKQELAAVPLANRKAVAPLVDFGVSTSIDEYYHPTTSEFPST